MVEGTPLLRVQIGNGLEGSNPFLSAIVFARPYVLDFAGFYCVTEIAAIPSCYTNLRTVEPLDGALLRGLRLGDFLFRAAHTGYDSLHVLFHHLQERGNFGLEAITGRRSGVWIGPVVVLS